MLVLASDIKWTNLEMYKKTVLLPAPPKKKSTFKLCVQLCRHLRLNQMTARFEKTYLNIEMCKKQSTNVSFIASLHKPPNRLSLGHVDAPRKTPGSCHDQNAKSKFSGGA